MQRQTLRDWVHRDTADGIAGLLDRPRPTRPGLLSAAQRAAFDAIVEAGPDVAVDGVVRWRRVDLKRVVERRFGVVMAERTIGDLLRTRGFRHLSVRPRHPNCDAAVQEDFKRMARPVCKMRFDGDAVCINVSGLRIVSWPRWISARLGSA